MTGYTGSVELPDDRGRLRHEPQRRLSDAFVTKLNAAGTALVYSTYLGGSAATTRATAIAVDGAGSAYVTGLHRLDRTSRPPRAPSTRAYNGSSDAFVTKLNAAGSALVYSTYLGGAVDRLTATGSPWTAAGNAYVTGQTDSADFPTTAGAFDTSYNGGHRRLRDEAERDRLGARLLHLPGRSVDATTATGIAVDGAGSAYVTGVHALRRTSRRPRAPSTRATTAAQRRLRHEAERERRRASSTPPTWAAAWRRRGYGIAVDGAGSAYVTGSTELRGLPDHAGAFDTSYNGGATTPS